MFDFEQKNIVSKLKEKIKLSVKIKNKNENLVFFVRKKFNFDTSAYHVSMSRHQNWHVHHATSACNLVNRSSGQNCNKLENTMSKLTKKKHGIKIEFLYKKSVFCAIYPYIIDNKLKWLETLKDWIGTEASGFLIPVTFVLIPNR